MALSDRIVVMFGGEITGVVDNAEATVEELGLMMGGGATRVTVGRVLIDKFTYAMMCTGYGLSNRRLGASLGTITVRAWGTISISTGVVPMVSASTCTGSGCLAENDRLVVRCK